MISSRFAIVCALAISATAACTDTESATNLKPDGPPMIEQVLLTESIFDQTGNSNDSRVFAFGTLPGLDASDEHDVSSAAEPPEGASADAESGETGSRGAALADADDRSAVGLPSGPAHTNDDDLRPTGAVDEDTVERVDVLAAQNLQGSNGSEGGRDAQ